MDTDDGRPGAGAADDRAGDWEIVPTRADATAYHEAGHVVYAVLHRITVDYATIRAEGDTLGHVMPAYGVEARRRPCVRAGFCVAGPVGQMMWEHIAGDAIPHPRDMVDRLATEWRSDLDHALAAVGSATALVPVLDSTRQVIESAWPLVAAVAEALLRSGRRQISGAQVRSIIRRRRAQAVPR